jgi:POT family proton-dependent oligopeptide transporter
MSTNVADITTEKTTFGHPRGLFTLFTAEFGERFSFYGMRAILILYMTKFLGYDDALASGIYASYCVLVYMLPVIGGILAEKYLGYRRAIIAGGVLMAAGQLVLGLQAMLPGGSEFGLYAGLALLCVGNGFFKPNISSTVGKLYGQGDPRRDAGFTIFYMGINLGGMLAPMFCGFLAESIAWPLGFFMAGGGMLFGIGWFLKETHYLNGKAEPSDPSTLRFAPRIYAGALLAAAVTGLLLWKSEILATLFIGTCAFTLFVLIKTAFSGDKIARDRMMALIALMGFHTLFWAFFEQAGSSLNLFTDRVLDRTVPVFGEIAASQFQSVNGLFILLLALPFSALWTFLARVNKQPSIPVKFALGLLQVGLGFGVLCFGMQTTVPGEKVALFYILAMYLLHTSGELCLSPVGLSAVTKLAPPKIVGFVMGAWFLTVAGGHELAGQIAKLTRIDDTNQSIAGMLAVYQGVYQNVFVVSTVAGLLLLALASPIRKLMHGIE